VFLGSQLTEGLLLVPHWKGLAPEDFYGYYAEFGPSIGNYYTFLTVGAALVPVLYSVCGLYRRDSHFSYFMLSALFMVMVIVLFFIFFKNTNQQFYAADLDATALKSTLENWEFWHWIRILFEMVSLVFLLFGFNTLKRKDLESNQVIRE
jgi:Na+/melibiose symporter-like transporter